MDVLWGMQQMEEFDEKYAETTEKRCLFDTSWQELRKIVFL